MSENLDTTLSHTKQTKHRTATVLYLQDEMNILRLETELLKIIKFLNNVQPAALYPVKYNPDTHYMISDSNEDYF